MKLLRQLSNLIFPAQKAGATTDFIYPYSDDPEIRREQIWQSLKKGILLEDTQILVPWSLPFNKMDTVKEQRRERADRTEWSLGKHVILSGYEASLEVMRWKNIPEERPIKRLTENLGTDDAGQQRFNSLRNHLTDLLGKPTATQLHQFNGYDTGEISWEKDDIALTLVGIEHFNIRYTFYIGLKMVNAIY